MKIAVETRAVSVTLGSTLAVDRVSLTVEPGEWVALIGPNGSGKTSLLRALAGLVPATGTIRLQGRGEPLTRRRDLAKVVALVPQLPETPPALTVAEYVLLGRTPHIGYLGSEGHADRLAAAEAIDRLALTAFIHRPLGSLSGGERQRVVLARALAQAAPILLLDEPTSALDLGRQQDALELLDRLRRQHGLSVISALHDLSLAGQYADRLILLDRGRVLAVGRPDEVLTEATISACYHADIRILHDRGNVFVLPRRSAGVTA
ncbi:MAG: ABC transporter ATP-binding protein [Solirubrobacteraceae bacterium]